MEEEPNQPPKTSWQEHIEKRARDLGLPTDPRAYQDGGLATAATAYNPTEAELIAAVLNDSGIPAWVDAPRSAVTLWHIQAGARAGGIRVLVPLGRLKDAQEALAGKCADFPKRPEPSPPQRLTCEARKVLWPGAVVSLILFPFAFYVLTKAAVLWRRARREQPLEGQDAEDIKTYLFLATVGAIIGLAFNAAIWFSALM